MKIIDENVDILGRGIHAALVTIAESRKVNLEKIEALPEFSEERKSHLFHVSSIEAHEQTLSGFYGLVCGYPERKQGGLEIYLEALCPPRNRRMRAVDFLDDKSVAAALGFIREAFPDLSPEALVPLQAEVDRREAKRTV